MEFESGLRELGNYAAREPLSEREQAFLDDHDRDRDLERARWMLMKLSKQHRISIDAVRNALLRAHIRQEARRIAGDAERLRELIAYVTRSEFEPDETDYLGMSPAEFYALERRLREAARERRG